MVGGVGFAVSAGLVFACSACLASDAPNNEAHDAPVPDAGRSQVVDAGGARASAAAGYGAAGGGGAGVGGRAAAGSGGVTAAGNAGTPGGARASTGQSSPDDLDAGSGELQPITLRFKPMVGNQAFDCWTNYAVPGRTGLTFSIMDFRFFVQQVLLVTRAGAKVPVTFDERMPGQSRDVALIDLAADEGGCVALDETGVNIIISGHVPAADYSAVILSLGVPEVLNHRDITQAKPPLDDTSMYWEWSNGYRFVSVMLAAAGDGVDPGTQTGVHIGAMGCTGSQSAGFRCSRPNRIRVRLDDFDRDASTIVADFGAAVADIDLSVVNQCHGGEPQCASAFRAFGLGADGAALDTQRVFRIE